MSEEILKALMELFALIVKQDAGILQSERDYVSNFLRKQLNWEAVNEYISLFDNLAGSVLPVNADLPVTAPSVKDSVKILGICKKINRTLNQEQKVVVLMRLYELVNAERGITPQRTNILNTVSEVFRIKPDEIASIEQFIKNNRQEDLLNPNIRFLSPGQKECELCHKMRTGYHDTSIVVLRVPSVDLYFIKFNSPDQMYLNGLPVTSGQVYSFAKGSSIRSRQGHPIYYSDISSNLIADKIEHPIVLNAENLTCVMADGHITLNNICFSAEQGNLLGILGASGAGKTTLLNILSGIQYPTTGKVTINNFDIHTNSPELEGVIGYVPQDDLLIEDLTVRENLWYAARQCFGDKTDEEIKQITDQTLANLGLDEKCNLKVGSPLNKVISGGQRKRLNIGLELIREPSILLLDEPTSGLSSRDSENLMDLLRDLTQKGKLIITVIHQPSSEVFKMFDKVIILDKGGYLAYFGNPVESVIYFKTLDSQINSSIGECPSCGNVNPEVIFNIMETQVVDEYGKYTEKRKVKPSEWAAQFYSMFPFTPMPGRKEPPHSNLKRPTKLKQLLIYLSRDLSSKLANRQYVLLTLLEAPVLGFILSFIIKYIPDPSSTKYVFFENENIPIYIFMSLIVALFIGLTISSEEIFRDRKIIKREHFLHLSRNSYLMSKVVILIIISSIQVFLFLVIANPMLGIKGLFLHYFIALFITAFCANMLGLNISSSFNSAITIYIIIPLVIIPMMVLSGAMFPFDKLNRKIGNVGKVPFIAELMPTRWTYEALMVAQFKDNKYSRFKDMNTGKTVYEYKKEMSVANFYSVKLVPSLVAKLERGDSLYRKGLLKPDGSLISNDLPGKDINFLRLIRNELGELYKMYPTVPRFTMMDDLSPERYNNIVHDSLISYLQYLTDSFNSLGNQVADQWDRFYLANRVKIKDLENKYSNLNLQEIVTKFYERERDKVLEYKDSYVQNYDPVYLDPVNSGFPGFRTHFFAPRKNFSGLSADTYLFNIGLVLFSIVVLYITLYFNVLNNIVKFFEKLRMGK
ncbi:MAG: ATP-binding cassette domain-containing protein [Bacteroidales bacterium]